MRTSGILTIGGGAVAALGGLFSVFMFFTFLGDKGPRFPDLVGLVFGLGIFAAGAAVFVSGRKRARLEDESDDRGFADTALALAGKGGGQVALDAVCRASGLTTEEAQARMRRLTGKGLFDLDFDANGQMVYKLPAGR
jgi:hypothetical protein